MKSITLLYVCALFLVVSWTASAGRQQPAETKVEEAKDAKVGKDYWGGGGGNYNHGGGGWNGGGGNYNHGGGGWNGGGGNYNHGGGGWNHGGGGGGGHCYHGCCGGYGYSCSCCSSAEEAKAYALTNNEAKP